MELDRVRSNPGLPVLEVEEGDPGDDDTETLVELLRAQEFPVAADKLEHALATGVVIVALTITDRESILWALDDAPTSGLAELRSVLLQELEWRVPRGSHNVSCYP